MQTALLGVLEETKREIEDGKMTMIVLFDFTKVIHCIPHKLLLINCANEASKMVLLNGYLST